MDCILLDGGTTFMGEDKTELTDEAWGGTVIHGAGSGG